MFKICSLKKQNAKWHIDFNHSHVKLFVSVDKNWKLIGRDKDYMRARGLEMFCSFKNWWGRKEFSDRNICLSWGIAMYFSFCNKNSLFYCVHPFPWLSQKLDLMFSHDTLAPSSFPRLWCSISIISWHLYSFFM